MSQPQIEVITVSDEDAGERIDKYLAVVFDEYSRVFIQTCIREGTIKLKRSGSFFESLKIGEKLIEGDEISFEIPEEKSTVLLAEKIDFPVLFEDEHMLVINKPAGLVVHPGAGIHEGTLVNALLGYSEETFRPMDEEGRPGIVHRLDKETSGVLVVAKSRKAKEKLMASFAKRKVDKFYLALVRGHIRMGIGTLETFIGRSRENRQKMRSFDEEAGVGKEATTHYKVLAHNKGATLLKVKIDTGRTHQIRVHMSEMGFPVIGDKIYGKKSLEMKDSPERHLLHAWRLKIDHPITKERMVFTAPINDDMRVVLDKFGIEINE
ncbi:MAG: RluA family pseudouridine synthase [Lentisphaeraceae bacterium]|nr:RluA family pseudouridine synthase [Lentisphaeraceae bacterium]